MRNRRLLRGAILNVGMAALMGVVLSEPAAHGAGFAIFEAGSKATAMSGAFVAQADDHSAMFYNPAGMTANTEKLSLMVGDTLIFFNSELKQGADPFPGSTYSAKQKKQIFFPPNMYGSIRVADGFNISIGTWFPYGLSTAWENPDSFRGRFLSQRVDLRQYALGLQAAVDVTPWLSIGAGPELRISDVKLQRNVPLFNPFTNRFVDAAHTDIVSDGFEFDLAFGAGIMLKPMPGLRIGAAFHSAVNADYKGDAKFYALSTGSAQLDAAFASRIPVNTRVPVRTTVQFPLLTMFGASYDFTDQLTLEVDGNYTKWDVFDKTVLEFDAVDGKQVPTSTLEHKWENTWTIRAGLNYKVTPTLNVAAGYVHDQTPQPDEDVSPLLPDASRNGVSIGFGLKVGQSTRLEVSNLFLFFHERTTLTNKDNFNGTYKTFADLLVLNLRTSF